MKILFVQFEPRESLAVEYLSAYLQGFGHSTSVLIVGIMTPSRIISQIQSKQPGMICVTDSGSNAERIKSLSALLKKNCSAKIVVGGYITINKEEVFEKDSNVDAYCIGSGFYLDRLIQYYESNHPAENIPNFIIRCNGTLIRNKLDSDSHFCDFKDRDMFIYRDYPFLLYSIFPFIMASYGCINNCSFCFYSGFKSRFGKKAGLCYKKPELVLKEILQIRKINRNFRCFNFVDDNMVNNINWLTNVMSIVKPLGLRFFAKIDINTCTEEMIRMMRGAGLFGATIGIEHINQNIRESLLNKSFTNDKLIKVISWLRKYGVHIRAYFIIGLPYQTEEDISENVSFARRHGLKEAVYTFLALLPNTVLREQIMNEYRDDDPKKVFPHSEALLTRLQLQQEPMFLPGAPLYISQLMRKAYFIYLKLRYYPLGAINLILYGFRLSSYFIKEYVLNIFDSVSVKVSR
jgi:radical SAM superfamily enzyme YgiQ (UPF0313 family)